MVKFNKHIFLNSVSDFTIPVEFSYKNFNNLLKEYPAFNSLQLLNAVLTNKENPELFQKNLSKIATKVIDRAILHDYIHKDKFTFEGAKLIAEKELTESIPEKIEEKIISFENDKKQKDELEIETTAKEKELDEVSGIKQEEELLIKEPIEEIKVVAEDKQEATTQKDSKEIGQIIENDTKKNKVQEEIIEETLINESPNSKNESRDLAFKNLSNDLFKGKLESITDATSEKDKKRIEAMKKLQEELFSKPVKKKALEKTAKPLIKKLEKKTIVEKTIEKENLEEKKKQDKQTKPLIAKISTPIQKVENPIVVEKEISSGKKNEKLTKADTEKLSPLERIRLAKKLKSKDSSQEKAKDLIARLKKQQEDSIKQEKSVSVTPASKLTLETSDDENSLIKAKAEDNVEDPITIKQYTHIQKIERLKAKIREHKLKETLAQKEVIKNVVKEDHTNVPTQESKQQNDESPILINTEKLVEEKEVTKPIVETKDSIKKPLSIHDFFKKTNVEKDRIKPEKKIIEADVKLTKDSNFLHWLKDRKGEKPIVSKEPKKIIHKKPFEKLAETKVVIEKRVEQKIIIKERVVEKVSKNKVERAEKEEDLIPFEKVSAIEHEMHKEIKKSTDPLDDFISGQISKKKKVRRKNTGKTISNVGLISETLAEILVIQQKYLEAIEVYNTLSMKYPEKSIYFAHQIEKIKNY